MTEVSAWEVVECGYDEGVSSIRLHFCKTEQEAISKRWSLVQELELQGYHISPLNHRNSQEIELTKRDDEESFQLTGWDNLQHIKFLTYRRSGIL